MSAPQFSTAQQVVVDMIDYAKAQPSSPIADVTVVNERLDRDTAQDADPALRDEGAVIVVMLPEAGSGTPNRESNFYFVNVAVVIMANPKVLWNKGGDLLSMMDSLLAAPTLYTEANRGPAFPKPLEVPVERIDEGLGYVAYALHYIIPVLQ